MLFISDIHGSATALDQALAWKQRLDSNVLVLLGDLLNHGPRNPIPDGYDPQAVASTLSTLADQIIAVRGNCDSEVDQMLCGFPLLAEYNWLLLEGRRLCLTHGHRLGPDNLPPLAPGEGIAFGHTHIPMAEWRQDRLHFNPGSVTLPRNGQPASFGHFDGERLRVMDMAGNTLASASWKRE
ncbi:phosphodiesterase [Ferrimonas gelatinilytica]